MQYLMLIYGQEKEWEKLSEEEMNSLFVSAATPFNEVAKTLESVKKLEKFVVNAMNNSSHSQLLESLLGLTETPVAGAVTEEDAHHASSWHPSQIDSAWFKWGIFYPKGMKREADFALFSLHERAKELGLDPVSSGQRTEDEGLYLVQHGYWKKAMRDAVAAEMGA